MRLGISLPYALVLGHASGPALQEQTQFIQPTPRLPACHIDRYQVTYRFLSLLLDMRETELSCRPIALVAATLFAGNRQILDSVRASAAFGYDVLHLQRHVGGLTSALVALLHQADIA
jgi:hypothetical protein